jgi:hypothetical protein
MSAVEALRAARAAGIKLVLDGDDLVLTAAEAPPGTVLSELSRRKPEIVALLRAARDNWSDADWLAFFDERAGIAEFDGGLQRTDAEARAFECCVVEWLNRNPVSSPPGGVSTAAAVKAPLTSWCRSEPSRPAMSGYIRDAGQDGMSTERLWQLLSCRSS